MPHPEDMVAEAAAQPGAAPPDEAEEEPIKLRRKAPEDTEIDITPMIDVTFLLLIFFLVTSKVGASGDVPLPYAQSGEGISTKNSIVITVVEASGDLAEVFLADGLNPDKRLAGSAKDQEEQIASYVREGLSGTPRKDHVILKAAKGVREREVTRIAQAVARAGEVKLHAAVLEEQ